MKICSAFYITVWIWIKLGKKCPKNWVIGGFVKIGAVKTFLFLQARLNWCPIWLKLVKAICTSCCWAFVNFPKIGIRKTVIFFWAQLKLYECSVLPYILEGSLGKLCLLSHGIHYWQSCFPFVSSSLSVLMSFLFYLFPLPCNHYSFLLVILFLFILYSSPCLTFHVLSRTILCLIFM